ncbi:protein ASPARTIC PROTEASE IN GUARD CELL 2-like [Rosa rugosa]|uniref:protein ASPARTIC PROTEASE IN GUARD CELL 2-like n=1 Tax=Rosa rugosa TaxID=74645 RepID=UPI002B401DCA|nr:protein ASPARTIC PROTEASE IN GUARD CELL 2-like [Rosa rugosa]XP_062016758.1 protein ASPARTIC PROTEASE IN GUARD CELL 2-like [Rosa rugosa]XP_062016759.1 protein ASPARTIC PROTEASE IN GUARD CELL 2-like [Rosa rugosa]XP_062016760.1 protein ASPARTIC PROTEASE IN GUARD CELL 2-like [Rosa rugosa]XP_062016761.1 protein ASPARTIC PROTEASE IN GUARD CELL 2-like [Rosa rugosa]XP_062016762.1 protein ASPARTIC PROTEASE IN GUARD CELL 2-like [Rosa rugosa]XP_062016763.1 protein ASPARTIC PROTEASE IN GUARD CELL 2-li
MAKPQFLLLLLLVLLLNCNLTSPSVFKIHSSGHQKLSTDSTTIPQPPPAKLLITQSRDLYFVVEINIGIPTQNFFNLALDIKNPFTWVGTSKPNISHSFLAMPGKDPLCLPPLFASATSCAYDFGYARGIFGFDYFLGIESQTKAPFGWGIFTDEREEGVLRSTRDADGILGLGVGHPANLLEGLGAATLGQFSYCLPMNFMIEESFLQITNSTDPQHHPATLNFGENAAIRGHRAVKTPIVRLKGLAPTRDFSYLNLTGIYVNHHRLHINTQVFHPSQGGFIVDTASPYTLLPEEAYKELRRAIHNFFSEQYPGLEPLKDPKSGFDMCLPTSPLVLRRPSIQLMFEGGAKLVLNPATTFHEFEDLNEFCLLILPRPSFHDGGSAPSVLGVLQQVGHRFHFDIHASILAFAPELCYTAA